MICSREVSFFLFDHFDSYKPEVSLQVRAASRWSLQRPGPSSFSEPNRFNPFERSFGSKHCNGGFLSFF